MKSPTKYITVEVDKRSEFDKRANELATSGYKIISSKILAIEMPEQDFHGFRYAAIFEYQEPEYKK